MRRMRAKDRSSEPDSEAKCRRCGRCCTVKYVVENVVFTAPHYCEYFDVKTHLCKIYHERRKRNPHCLDVGTGLQMGVFPADCPYAEGRADYMPPYPVALDLETERAILNGTVCSAEEVIERLMNPGLHTKEF
jgi:uncharacterized protein